MDWHEICLILDFGDENFCKPKVRQECTCGKKGIDHMTDFQLESLTPLFDPKSIAVIGASSDWKRLGGRPLKYLLDSGYQGKIYPINPKYTELFGLPCYPDITAVGAEIDLAIIALPKEHVADSVRKCGQAKVRSVVIFSAGFAEVDEEGRALQDEIRTMARANGIRVLGRTVSVPSMSGRARTPRFPSFYPKACRI